MSPNNTLKKRVFVKKIYIYKIKSLEFAEFWVTLGDIQGRDDDSGKIFETIRMGTQYDTEA